MPDRTFYGPSDYLKFCTEKPSHRAPYLWDWDIWGSFRFFPPFAPCQVEAVYRYLYWDKLGLTESSFPASARGFPYHKAFGPEGAGDAGVVSSVRDMQKFAAFSLRKGKLEDGTELIQEKNWEKWAMTSNLAGGKLTDSFPYNPTKVDPKKDISKMSLRDIIYMVETGEMPTPMQLAGNYGWSFFGATFGAKAGATTRGDLASVQTPGLTTQGL